jgi:hypothetical protein
VAQVQAIFEQDWQAQAELAAGRQVAPLQAKGLAAPSLAQTAMLFSSPAAFNPAGVIDSETGLPALLAEAKEEVRVQLLDYAPLSYGPKGTRPYYAVVDNAVRAAANRGVKIKPAGLELESGSPAAGIPQEPWRAAERGDPGRDAAQGLHRLYPIRARHPQQDDDDRRQAGMGGHQQLVRRLLRPVAQSRNRAAQRTDGARIAAVHEQIWTSQYAEALDITKQYPKPKKGEE